MATRSPNYPAVGLSEAVRMARQLWDQEERSPVTAETAVGAFGYESLSGPARTKLAALKKYGLIEDTPHGIRLSALAVRILHSPEVSREYGEAVREAALSPELFRELAQNHTTASEKGLQSYLLTQKEFSSTGAKVCARSFLDTVEFAKLDNGGYLDEETSSEPESNKEQPTMATVAQQAHAAQPKVLQFSWPLSRDVSAEVRFTGADIRPSHLERLRAYLELAKEAVADSESEVTPDEGNES
ncbi:MAG: hypothetical protein H0W34_02810 [Pyrinomonadaceae bacterium]|nr:hypothetical protein [Pyrinomonadaceae bacterium]